MNARQKLAALSRCKPKHPNGQRTGSGANYQYLTAEHTTKSAQREAYREALKLYRAKRSAILLEIATLQTPSDLE